MCTLYIYIIYLYICILYIYVVYYNIHPVQDSVRAIAILGRNTFQSYRHDLCLRIVG